MVYYYCTNSTFLSIINHRSLWLSDMTQSNDSYEIHKYVEIVTNAIKTELASIPKIEKNDIPQKGPKLKEYQINESRRAVYTSAIKKLAKEEENYYCLAICFSDIGDNLSQWRGYGDDGYGISIGFDEERIEELCSQHSLFKYEDVYYYSSVEDSIIQEKLKGYIEELDNLSQEPKISLRNKSGSLKNWARNILDNDAPFLKPAGFIDERETRFCFVRYISPYEMLAPKEESHLHGVGFHAGNHAIVPHYELLLKDSSNVFMSDIIREITIGPCNFSTKNSILCLLAQNGFDIPQINVHASNISYRSRR